MRKLKAPRFASRICFAGFKEFNSICAQFHPERTREIYIIALIARKLKVPRFASRICVLLASERVQSNLHPKPLQKNKARELKASCFASYLNSVCAPDKLKSARKITTKVQILKRALLAGCLFTCAPERMPFARKTVTRKIQVTASYARSHYDQTIWGHSVGVPQRCFFNVKTCIPH